MCKCIEGDYYFEWDCVGVCRCFGDGLEVCIYLLYLKYCTVGDHFGFQVGFLKQYFVWVCLYWFLWMGGE